MGTVHLIIGRIAGGKSTAPAADEAGVWYGNNRTAQKFQIFAENRANGGDLWYNKKKGWKGVIS